jgi:copper chaperone
MTDAPIVYRVDGMTCGGCARSVTTVVKAVAPTLQVEVDHEKGTVTTHGPHDPAAIQAAIEGAGFTWAGLSAH